MMDTPRSLLERLRLQPDEESWNRLIALYTPLLQGWLQQVGINGADAEDLLQEVFTTLVREIASFEHNQRSGAFRRWLRTILVNRLRGFLRDQRTRPQPASSSEAQTLLASLEDPASELSRLWDRQHDTFIARRLLELIEPEFAASTWQVFRMQVIDGRPPAEVAEALGLSLDAVYTAKSRVLRRLRREIEGLADL
jgi:RNA polymerase sigma-70 factor (ECF subfamily)